MSSLFRPRFMLYTPSKSLRSSPVLLQPTLVVTFFSLPQRKPSTQVFVLNGHYVRRSYPHHSLSRGHGLYVVILKSRPKRPYNMQSVNAWTAQSQSAKLLQKHHGMRRFFVLYSKIEETPSRKWMKGCLNNHVAMKTPLNDSHSSRALVFHRGGVHPASWSAQFVSCSHIEWSQRLIVHNRPSSQNIRLLVY